MAVFVMFATRPSPDPVFQILKGGWIEDLLTRAHSDNPILFNLAVGYIVSTIFWMLVVYLPERRRREIIRNSLARCYVDFKEAVVSLMLGAVNGSIPSGLMRQLSSNHKDFREYFESDGKWRWHAFLNALSDSETRLADLRLEFEKLRAEVGYVLSSVQIDDESVHEDLKRIQEVVLMLNNWSGFQDDPAKYLGRELWGLLARFSFSGGYVEQDFIETLISRIK